MLSSKDGAERLRTALVDRYTVLREIGSGGMATVYLAHDLRHDRQVALKVLKPEVVAVVGGERFLTEIRTTAHLQHPNILPLFDSGEADGQLFYVMPYVEGESLRDRLNREKQLPVDEAVQIASEVAEALQAAHDDGVIHRDIKPANILLRKGKPQVADFGIALAVRAAGGDRLTETGLSLGTPAYMSPEQVTGEQQPDARADVYSLGCVLYEMLVGEPPFTGPTTQVVMARHLAADVPSILAVRSAVPGPVVAAVMKALSKAPSDRHSSMRGFREALFSEPAQEGEDRRSIAVLPFTNMSADSENEFFSDGITEEIINALSKLADLRVAARSSSFAFKGGSPDIKEVGAKLDVATVLEGSVRRSGDRLRITAQLINVTDGYHLWSERYDRDMDDVFAIQDEIAAAVVEELKVSLLGSREDAAGMGRTSDPEAYELLLRGRYLFNLRALPKALEYFQKAADKDPGYAPAHSGMADALAMIGFYGGTKGHDAFREGRAAARRALAIDPKLAQAHAILGFIAMWYDWDWSAAEAELLRAMELDPRNVDARHWHGQFLGWIRADWDAAIATLREAQEIDPLSVTTMAQLGAQLVNGGRPEEGLVELEKTLELAPDLVLAKWYRGMACRRLARWEESIETLRRAIELSGGSLLLVGELALTHAGAGRRREAQAILDEGVLGETLPSYAAMICSVLGQEDQSFEWLEDAFERRDPLLAAFAWNPDLELDREDLRFKDLGRRMNWPGG